MVMSQFQSLYVCPSSCPKSLPPLLKIELGAGQIELIFYLAKYLNSIQQKSFRIYVAELKIYIEKSALKSDTLQLVEEYSAGHEDSVSEDIWNILKKSF